MRTSFTLQVDFTDEWFAANIDNDRWDEAEDLFFKIEGVKTVCLNHMCWIEADGNNAVFYEKEVAKVIETVKTTRGET